jgi:hypothetical protein
LDFYHAAKHLWAFARDLFGDEKEAHEWVASLLKRLKRYGGTKLLSLLKELLEVAEDEWPEEECQILRRKTAYFQNHSSRLDYPQAKRQGFFLGSEAREKIYACPMSAYFDHFNEYFGEHFKLTGKDCIDIHEIQSFEEIAEFAARPVPFCGYCDIRGRELYPWGQSKLTINEYADLI